MATAKLAHLDNLILEVDLASLKTILQVLANRQATLEPDCLASLLPRLLPSGPVSQHRLALVLAASLALSSLSQLQMACSGPRLLLSQALICLVPRDLPQAALVVRVIAHLGLVEGRSETTTTIISSSSQSQEGFSAILLLQAGLGKTTIHLAPLRPIIIPVVVSSAIRVLKPILHSGKRNSRLNPIRSVALVSHRIKLKPTLRLLAALASPNSKTRSLGESLAANSPIVILEEVFSETWAKTTTSNSLLEEIHSVILLIIRQQVRYLHRSRQRQLEASSGTIIHPTRILEDYSEPRVTTPVQPSSPKVAACLETTSRISQSLEVSLGTRQTLEAASLAISAITTNSNKEATLSSGTTHSSSKVVSSATPIITTIKTLVSSVHSSSPSSNQTFLHHRPLSVPL